MGLVVDITDIVDERLRAEVLFEASPVALRLLDMTPAVSWLDGLRDAGVVDFAAYFAEHDDEAAAAVGRIVVTTANLAAAVLAGVDREALLGPLSDQPDVAPNTPGAASGILGALAAGAMEHRVDGDLVRADGSLRHVQLRFVVSSVGGQPDYSRVVGSQVDITDIVDERLRAEELSELKSRLIATVAHELRTPLTGVVGFSHLLETGWRAMSEVEVDEMVGVIASTGRQMGGIVEDLLASARSDLGELAVVPSTVFLFDEAKAALPTVDLGDREVFFVGDDVTAWVDGGRLRQIVRNLVSNAVRHGDGPIRIEAFAKGGRAFMRVHDQGGGIAPEQSDRMFEPYWIGHQGKGHTESIGLGLSLSRLLAERMDGNLVYRRHDDETVFELELPLTAPQAPGGQVTI